MKVGTDRDRQASTEPVTRDLRQAEPASTVLIMGNIRLYRDALAAALGGREELRVIGALDCHRSTIDETIANDPNVVLIDVAERESLHVVRALRRELPATKLVAFAVDEQESELLNLAEAGVAGYVTVEASLDDLICIIGSVLREEVVCPPRLASTLLKRLAHCGERDTHLSPEATLTEREQQVVELLREGMSNKEIALAFNISEATVKNHVHHVLDKLKVNRRSQVASRSPMGRPSRSR